MIKKRIIGRILAPIALLLLTLALTMAIVSCDTEADSPKQTALEGQWQSGSTTITFNRDSFTTNYGGDLAGIDNMWIKGTFSLSGVDQITLNIKQFSMDGGNSWKTLNENNLIDAIAISQVGETTWNLLSSQDKQMYRDMVKQMMSMYGVSFSQMINEMKTQTGTYQLNGSYLYLVIEGEPVTLTWAGGAGGPGGPVGSGASRSQAISLTGGVWRNGTISPNGEVWYKFPVSQGNTYYVWWNDGYTGLLGTGGDGTKTADIYVSAYYNNESELSIFSHVDSAWTSPRTIIATQNGTVYLQVTPYISSISGSSSGTFGIVYSTSSSRPGSGGEPVNPGWNPPSSYTSLNMNEWRDGNLTSSVREVWYSFYAYSGTTYYVWMDDSDNSSQTVDAAMAAYYSSGTSIFSGDYNSRSFTATSSGTVYVRVYPYGSGSGTFRVAYSTTSAKPGSSGGGTWNPPSYYTTLSINEWRNDTKSSGVDNWHAFSVSNGSTYYVWWNDSYQGDGTKTADVYVYAYYSDGTVIFSDVDSGWTSGRSFTANRSGTVYLRVTSSSGSYGITYSTSSTRPGGGSVGNSRDNAISLYASQMVSGSLTSSVREVWYSFYAYSGTTYYVWMDDSDNSSQTVDAAMAAYYSSGTSIFSGDYNSRSFTATSSGTVYVRVYPYGSGIGTFRVAYSTYNSRP